ncbi:MAG: HEAT repeat domain-containing protein [Chloroflexota bacterium]
MPALDDLLAELTSGDESRAEAAVPALAKLGAQAVAALARLLDSPDADSRWWAVRALASHPDLDVDLLLRALADAAPEVRQAAALGLCSHPHERAIQPLVRALSDADSLAADLAAKALVAVGRPAVESLIEVQKDANMSARILSMRALAEIADPRAVPVMMSAIEGESSMLYHWAEVGLERLGLNMVYLKPE